MATAEEIRIRIIARDEASRVMGNTQKATESLSKAIGRLKIGLGIAAAGFTALSVQSLRNIDSLAKTSDKLGITTEALSSLGYAAELSGVGAKTMEMSLQRLTRRVAEAGKGSGEAKGALEELGINAAKLAELPVDEQLKIIADRMQGVESQSDKVRLAFKLFDSEGVNMVNMLKDGSAGLLEMQNAAAGAGATFTREGAAGVEKFNDTLTKISAQISGAVTASMVELAPTLTNIAEAFSRSLTPALNGVIATFKWIDENIGLITAGVRALVITFAVSKTLSFGAALFGAARSMLILGKAALLSGRTLKKSVVGVLIAAGIAIADMNGGLDVLYEKIGLGSMTLSSFDSEINDISDSMEKFKMPTQGVVDAVLDLPPAVSAAKGGISDLKDEVENAGLTMKDVDRNAIARLEDGLVGLVNGTMSAKDAFKSMASSIVQDLIRMQIQQSITGPLSGALSGFLSPGASADTVSFAGGGFTGSGSRTGGVDGKGGFPAILHPNETVVDHTRGQSSAGGVVVNQTINVTTGVQQTVRTEIASLMPQIANASKAAVLDARKRGGSFAGAFS